MNVRSLLFIIPLAAAIFFSGLLSCSGMGGRPKIDDIYVQMGREELFKVYPIEKARGIRIAGQEEWYTFYHSRGIVTFHLNGGKMTDWKLNDRTEAVVEYITEFVSAQFAQNGAKIGKAIEEVLYKMPYDDFLRVTDRHRPVIMTETWDSGTARFASSTEFIVGEQETPCCQEGFTLLKLSLALNQAKTGEAIEGIVAHELAHRILEHIKRGQVSCQSEREANALIKKWGFIREFKEAGEMFGHKEGDPAGCQEK